MILFLDASILIWRVEGLPPLQRAALDALADVRKRHGDIGLAVSRISWLECRVRPLRENDRSLLAGYAEFFAGGVRVVELSAEVVDRAAEFRAKFGIKTPDALQAASALALPGPVIFLTGDSDFSRVKDLDVRIVKPLARPKRSTS